MGLEEITTYKYVIGAAARSAEPAAAQLPPGIERMMTQKMAYKRQTKEEKERMRRRRRRQLLAGCSAC